MKLVRGTAMMAGSTNVSMQRHRHGEQSERSGTRPKW
jgi:hypothetical protein